MKAVSQYSILLLTWVITGCAGNRPPVLEARSSAGEVSQHPAASGLDCHVHLPANPTDSDRLAIFQALDQADLSRACVLSRGYHPAPGCADRTCEAQRAFTTSQNDRTVELARISAGRFLAFCGIPLTSGFAEEEVNRCAQIGARGLKVHLVSEKVSLVSPIAPGVVALDALISRAAVHRLPILIHAPMESKQEVESLFQLVAKHPEAVVIAAHQIAQQLPLLPQAPRNLWIELSGLPHAPAEAGAAFVPLWRAFGMDRVLLGSDWPQLTPAAHVERLRAYPLTEEERAAILEGNGRRLFPER